VSGRPSPIPPHIAARHLRRNLLNPKPSIFFVAFLPQFVGVDAESPLLDISAPGLAFMGLTFAVFAIYGAVAGWLRRSFAAGFGLLAAAEA